MEITVTIKAPDLAAAIQSLADAIVAAGCIPVDIPPVKDVKITPEMVKALELDEAPVSAEEPSKDTESETKTETKTDSTFTLEQVRAKLADLSRGGKQAEVKALLNKLGAKKLTEVPEDKYPELMQEAEAI